MLLVASMMRWFQSLGTSGTVKPEGAVGATARVYLKVPANNSGRGKITVGVQGRTQEYSAFTNDDQDLPTGSACRVVAMTTEDTFEVSALGKEAHS